MGNVIRKQSFETRKRHQERQQHVRDKHNEIPSRYEGDIRRYIQYCSETDQPDGVEALLDYLYVSLKEQRIKKTTWERRLAAVRKHLTVVHGVDFKTEPKASEELSAMRKMYKEEERADQIILEGQSALDKQEVLEMIYKLPVREKAITYVNLITANRPSDMVRMQIKDFDFNGRFVRVYLPKQSKWHSKRLTQEVIKVVKDYIKAFNLKGDDYLIGRVNKSGVYTSAQITESGYSKALHKWLGITGYNLRKTQVVAMHSAGADLPTIAKQTGHESVEVLSKHYLQVSDTTVDKYL